MDRCAPWNNSITTLRLLGSWNFEQKINNLFNKTSQSKFPLPFTVIFITRYFLHVVDIGTHCINLFAFCPFEKLWWGKRSLHYWTNDVLFPLNWWLLAQLSILFSQLKCMHIFVLFNEIIIIICLYILRCIKKNELKLWKVLVYQTTSGLLHNEKGCICDKYR